MRKHDDETVFLPLPPALRRPIAWGCQCSYCKAHPEQVPAWDVLAGDPETGSTWTVHYPEFQFKAVGA